MLHHDDQRSARKPRKPKHPGGDERLYYRGRTIWCRVPDPQGTGQKVRLSTGCKDPIAAIAKANEYERHAANPSYRTAAETSLEEAIADLQVGYQQKGRAMGTIRTLTNRLGHFVRLWGKDFPVGKINGALVNAFVETRKLEKVGRGENGELSRTTIGVEIMALRALLRRARYLGKFPYDCEEVIETGMIGKQARAVERWATMEEAWQIIKAMPPRAGAQLAFICGTGCRAEEARRARRSHFAKVDFSKAEKEITCGFITIDGTKTKHCREVAREVAASSLTAPFLAYALEHGDEGEYPFTLAQAYVRRMIHKAMTDEGMEGWRETGETYSPNDFRRGFCHWHMDAGYSEDVAALLLRHQDTTMVRQVYGQHDRRGNAIEAKMREEAKKKGIHVVPNLYGANGQVSTNEYQGVHKAAGNAVDQDAIAG